MKKILIIGASILQLPAIKKAKASGYYVGVIDYNPDAIGVKFADKFFNVSTIDIDGVVAVAKQFAPDGIMTLATDMPMRSIAAACSELGLPGISLDTAIKSTDKGEMIKAFEANGVEHPWYYILKSPDELSSIIDEISFPCISKPTDNSGSRGVMLVHNADELVASVEYSSENGRSGGVIIEEFLQGTEVSVEIIVIDGDVHILNVTDKLTTGAPHFVEMGHSQPSRLSDDSIHKICDLARRAVLSVGINNSPAHVEIMLTENGPKMIELGARMGGDCITTHLVPLSTGIDMVDATMRIACGEAIDIQRKFNKASAIRYFYVRKGRIKSIENVEIARDIEGVVEIAFVKNAGDVVGDIGNSSDRVGFVISQADDATNAVKVCERVLDTVVIRME